MITWQKIKSHGYQGVVVPAKDAPRFFAALEEEHGRYWTPDPADVERLEAGVEDYLGELPQRTQEPCGPPVLPPGVAERLAEYRRQYAGFVAGDDDRLIRANFFCDARGRDWTSEPVAVEDGGACFFRMTYDPAIGLYSDLQINGGG